MSKEKIIDLFYIEHLQVKEISNIVNTSSAYVTKIIKQDARYSKEKNDRKSKSKENRKISKNKFIKSARENKRFDDNYDIIQVQNIQAAMELYKIYRKFNSSAYKYNPSRHRYEFDEKLGRSYAIPKYIKER